MRSVLGLLQTPLERMHEAVRNCYILASRLVGKQRKFAAQMMEYIGSVWLRGHYDVHSWNMSGHQEQQTNKLGNNTKIQKHPNFWALVDVLKSEFKTTINDAIMASVGNANVKKSKCKFKLNSIDQETGREPNKYENTLSLAISQ